MTTLIVDCDGVLLNWRDAFNQWMVDLELVTSVDEWKADQYDLPGSIDPVISKKLMRIFNQTHYISKLAPIPGATKALKAAHAAGYSIRVVTAFSDQYESIRMREDNLINAFGPIFQEIISLPVKSPKIQYLQRQPKDSIYVEDIARHLQEAIDVGMNPSNLFMIPQPWNLSEVNIRKYGVSVANWAEIYQQIIGV